jgi:hypothetical protein
VSVSGSVFDLVPGLSYDILLPQALFFSMRLSANLVLGCHLDYSSKLVVLFTKRVAQPSPLTTPNFQINCDLIGSCHRSFDIWTGQNVRKILRRHLLIKACNCFVIVLLATHLDLLIVSFNEDFQLKCCVHLLFPTFRNKNTDWLHV